MDIYTFTEINSTTSSTNREQFTRGTGFYVKWENAYGISSLFL